MSKRSLGTATARRLLLLAAFGLGLVGAVVRGAPALAASPTAPTTTSSCPSYNPPNELVLAGGTPQSAKLGSAFATDLSVGLAAGNGCPITTPEAGIAVTFTAPASGPSGTFSASGSDAVLVGTNATGQATAPPFTADSLPGGYLVVASSEVGSVSFSLVNTASGVPTRIAVVSPARQSATVSNRYAHPLQARVLDANGAPVPGTVVTFQIGSSGAGAAGGGGGAAGAASPGATFQGGSSQATETTDADGVATSPPLIANGTAGRFTATATVAGGNAIATFALANLAAKPPRVSVIGSPHQSTTVGHDYPHPLEVRVRTAQGGALQGVTVTFAIASGESGAAASASGSNGAGASFVGGTTQLTATTDARGIATTPRLTANTVAGTFKATATTAGATKAAAFRLTNLAGKPPRVTVIGRGRQSTTVGTRYPHPLEARVRTAQGAPLQGATVTFAIASGESGAAASASGDAGASFLGGTTQVSATTDARGIATTPRLTANTVAGTFTATAATTGATKAAAFTLHNLAAKAATITAGAASGQSTPVGTKLPIRLAVTVDDEDGNPVPDATVTFRAPERGPGGRFTTRPRERKATTRSKKKSKPPPARISRIVRVETSSKGIAIAPPFTANSEAGGYIVIATVEGAGEHVAFALVNLARTGG